MDGILVVDKPADWTSHDVVDFVRKRFHIKKAGHSGTLDPLATGVLVLLLGRSTKLAKKFMEEDKEYQATLTLGIKTDTSDSYGNILEKKEGFCVSREDAEKVFKEFVGELVQVPPMVSAIRHKGKRLYELARQGKVVERKPRNIRVYELEILGFNFPEVSFRVKCSKGTYIRTLCEEIGEKLGCGAHLSMLRRIMSGELSLNKAVAIETLRSISRTELKGFLITV